MKNCSTHCHSKWVQNGQKKSLKWSKMSNLSNFVASFDPCAIPCPILKMF